MKKFKILLLGVLFASGLCLLGNRSITLHAQESLPASEIESSEVPSEEVEESEEIVSEEISGAEEETDQKNLEEIIETLKEQLEYYKALCEDETIKAIITAIIGFVTTLGALFVKFKSIDTAELTLTDAKQILAATRTEIETLSKSVIELKNKNNDTDTKISESNSKNEQALELIIKSINVLNKSLIRLTDRIDLLEKKEGK